MDEPRNDTVTMCDDEHQSAPFKDYEYSMNETRKGRYERNNRVVERTPDDLLMLGGLSTAPGDGS
jgi:hypothetical protein